MKFSRFTAALGVVAALAIGVAAGRAAYVVKDGAGATQTFASYVTGFVHWPAHVMGALLSGTPTAATMTGPSGAIDVNPVGGATAANQATANTTLASLLSSMNGSTPAGTADIGSIGLQAHATGGCTPKGYQSAASNNSTSSVAVPATFCGGVAINTTATLYYLRVYDTASAPTCSSATNFIATIPIPASTSGNGTLLNIGGTYGAAFANGIGFCLTGGGTSTDNTSAATGVFLAYSVK